MLVLFLVLYVAALVCFILAAVNSTVRKVNLVALGLALCSLVLVIQTFQKV